jgi:hypothetical protein
MDAEAAKPKPPTQSDISYNEYLVNELAKPEQHINSVLGYDTKGEPHFKIENPNNSLFLKMGQAK